MKERLFGKLKQNKAFTLMETLVVVAVIVVLLGIGAVNVAGWMEDLRMKELDSYAKTIYLEAQNQLSSMEVEGGLPSLSKKLSQVGGGYEGRVLSEAPSDYWDNGNISDRWGELYYLLDEDAIISEFVPKFAFVNNGNGKYLIEIAPNTGEIYGVFYWTDDNEYVPDTNTATPSEIYAFFKNEMKVADGDDNNRQMNSRMKYEVGYYGGTLSETTVVTDYSLNQKLQVVNDEELYVVVSFDRKGKMLDYQNSNKFEITFTIEDEKNPGDEQANKWTYVMNAKEVEGVVTEGGSRIEFALLLDSSVSGFDFNTNTGGNLVSGEDLTIKVGTTFWHEDLYLIEEPITDSVNSYFDEVVASENVVEVSKVRHLNNLNKYSSTSDITIKQSGNIDFKNIVYAFDTSSGQAVYVGKGNSTTTAPAFMPISNSLLFSVSMGRNVTFDGNSYEIRNLSIVAENTENVGLFASAANVEFNNVKIVDPVISAAGSKNVGVLAGQLTGCTVNNCGVYLNTFTRDDDGVKNYYSQNAATGYANAMEERYSRYSVTGDTNVGGLAGATVDSQITNSFAAIKVNGKKNIGGFIGSATNTAGRPSFACITKCYSSGAVKHTSSSATIIGGFIGYAKDLYVTDAYTTSDIYGNNYIGGFLGKAEGSVFGRCNAYGEVLNRSGNDSFSSVNAGGFISEAGNVDSDVELDANGKSTSHYLKQFGYNDEDKLDAFDGALSATYVDLTVEGSAEGAILARTTFAYSDTLTYKAFPFTSVTNSHYGNFPLQFTINNSLVYYEKYSEKEYGYYCVTSLNGDTAEDYVWVLNTLQNRTCIEDGYALLSMYYLEEITYKNYQYKGSTWSEVGGNTLNTETNTYGADKMVLLSQQGVLQFKAYTPSGENAYTADYSGKSVKSSFTISGMYMYQLPYALQNTDREHVDNFYDVIVFDDGYAKGNDATPVVENLAFYYCPHFAKLAVNPGTGVTSSDGTVDDSVITNKSFEKLEQPTTVYVRSARQLNALGRVPYYWNDRGGVTKPITYVQEVDINFGTYAGTAKKYCGEIFNLVAFDTGYENQPIGQRNDDSSSNGAFANNYDGNYKKIIDYCVKSSNQYVGLFGEIYKESGATESQIRNVVMLVENPGNSSTASDIKDRNNAGFIIGTYQEHSTKSGNERQRTGVGALVGSDYTIGKTDGEASVFTIYNCASADYQVQYHITPTSSGYQQPLGIALGGMIGYSRGNVAQSSAVNNVKLVLRESITGNTAAVLVGGFTGSASYGTTLNCYSGGTIDVDDNGGSCYITRLRIGGFCPGWLYAPGIENTSNSEMIRYQNIYSYARVQDRVWSVKEDASSGKTFDHLIPTVSRMRLYYERRMTGLFKYETKWHTDSENGSDGARVPGFSYYLTSAFPKEESSGATEYYENSSSKKPKTCDPATYTRLSTLSWVNSNTDAVDGKEVKFISTTLYPTLKKVTSGSYPFPAFVKDAKGNYVHYGDWPTE